MKETYKLEQKHIYKIESLIVLQSNRLTRVQTLNSTFCKWEDSHHKSLAVKWLRVSTLQKKERELRTLWQKIKKEKLSAKGSSKGITAGKAVVQLRKQEYNCFRLQYNSVVTSKLCFEWDKMMTDLVLTCTCIYSADKIRAVNQMSGVKKSHVLGNLRIFLPQIVICGYIQHLKSVR